MQNFEPARTQVTWDRMAVIESSGGLGVLPESAVLVSRAWTARFGLLWFGLWMANLARVVLVLPNQFDALDPRTRSATSAWRAD